jgi:hypothetical protein
LGDTALRRWKVDIDDDSRFEVEELISLKSVGRAKERFSPFVQRLEMKHLRIWPRDVQAWLDFASSSEEGRVSLKAGVGSGFGIWDLGRVGIRGR